MQVRAPAQTASRMDRHPAPRWTHRLASTNRPDRDHRTTPIPDLRASAYGRAESVKNAQMTVAPDGVVPAGCGKECFPPVYTANPSRVPCAQPVHVVSCIVPRAWTRPATGQPSVTCRRATCTVAGGDSLPLSPGWYGTAVSFMLSIWRMVTGRLT